MRYLSVWVSVLIVSGAVSAFASGTAPQIKYRDNDVGTVTGRDATADTAARMQDQKDSQAFDLGAYIDEAVTLARPVYTDLSQPRVVLYFNKKFSSNVVDFLVMQKNEIITESAGVNVIAGLEGGAAQSTLDAQDNAGNALDGQLNTAGASGFVVGEAGAGSTKTTTQVQQRVRQEGPYARPAQIFTSQFKAGVSEVLRKVPVRQVDQSAISRLAAGEAEPSSLTLNEMKALSTYADYLAEFLFVQDGNSVSGFSVEIRMIRISDGMLVGMDLHQPQIMGETTEFEITEAGFQEVTYQDIPNPRGVGAGSGAALLNLFVDSAPIL